MAVKMIIRVRSGGEFTGGIDKTMADASDEVRRLTRTSDEFIEFGTHWIRVSDIESVTLERA